MYGLRNICDGCKEEDLFVKMYTRHYYNIDCLNTNKYVHFKLLLKERGFSVKDTLRKTKQIRQKDHSDIANEFRQENFNIETEKNTRLNNILKVPVEEVDQYTEFFLQPTTLQHHFNISTYLHKNRDNCLLDLKNMDEFNSKKTKCNLSKILFLKKMEQAYDCCIDNIDIKVVDIPKSEADNLFIEYRQIFGDRSKKVPNMMNKYDVIKVFTRIYRHLFGKDVLTSHRVCIAGVRTFQYQTDDDYLKLHQDLYQFRQPIDTTSKTTTLWNLDKIDVFKALDYGLN